MDPVLAIQECYFRFSRSGGKGGQHVNKVSSKAELLFSLNNSAAFTDEEKSLLYKKLHKRLTEEGLLIITCEETRSQRKNKEIAIEKFTDLLKKSLVKPKPRKATKPTKASREKRIDNKKRRSEIKKNRGKV